MKSVRPAVWIGLLLAALTLAVYGRVIGFEFVNYDDPEYVYANAHLAGGLSADNVRWALTTPYQSTWQPLVWLSYMLDWQVGRFNPAVFHATNVILHLGNVLLWFLVLSRATGSLWRSALVAALFGVHPLHVESVAWIAERKDVLATLFWLLGTGAYLAWVRRPRAGWYTLVFVALALGLISKPLLVTFPLSLLLLDYWPLGRIKGESRALRAWWPLLREKIPLLLLVAASSAVAYHVQRAGGAITAFDTLALRFRIANGAFSYVKYLQKTFWPSGLAVIYPHLGTKFPLALGLLAGLLLVGLSLVLLRSSRRRPYLGMGWVWYLTTLLPMIGLIQFGEHALADRFTYVPLTGVFVMFAWSVPDLCPSARSARVFIMTTGLVVILLGLLGQRQVGYWRDSQTLFEHALASTTNNAVAHNNLGYALELKGLTNEARTQYQEALRIDPGHAATHANLAGMLLGMGQTDAALIHSLALTQLRPLDPKSHFNHGLVLQTKGATDQAIREFQETIRLQPDSFAAHDSLGDALLAKGRIDEAVAQYAMALRLNPQAQNVRRKLAAAGALKKDTR